MARANIEVSGRIGICVMPSNQIKRLHRSIMSALWKTGQSIHLIRSINQYSEQSCRPQHKVKGCNYVGQHRRSHDSNTNKWKDQERLWLKQVQANRARTDKLPFPERGDLLQRKCIPNMTLKRIKGNHDSEMACAAFQTTATRRTATLPHFFQDVPP